MKIRALGVFLLVLLFLLTGIACGQSQKIGPDGNPIAVDVSEETHHSFVFENELVRVFALELGPQKETVLYRHPHDFVQISFSGGALQSATLANGSFAITHELAKGDARFIYGPKSRRLRNSDAVITQRMILLEVKKASSPDRTCIKVNITMGPPYRCTGDYDVVPPPLDWSKSFAVALDRDTVRLRDVQVLPGENWQPHESSLPFLIVAISDLEFSTAVEKSSLSAIRAGGIAWEPDAFHHALTNTGRQPARFIVVEFK